MSHNIEYLNGKYSMVYAGEEPWHGLGKRILDDLTPQQVLEEAGLNWRVDLHEITVNVNGKTIEVPNKRALVRDVDNRVLDIVSDDWCPVQNEEAFEFFHEFVMNNSMSMHTAGSLQNGNIVWALAKLNDGFSLNGQDEITGYLLFTNYHKYGFSTDVRFTAIRVVCNNTLTLALQRKSKENSWRFNHRCEFDANHAKRVIGLSSKKLNDYREMAEFLTTKRYNESTVMEYFDNLFPITGTNKRSAEHSRSAIILRDVLEQQPGFEYSPGTWWQAYNAVTFFTDHIQGRNEENRIYNAWYGRNLDTKSHALKLAVEMANAA